jgi:hypothetical protein
MIRKLSVAQHNFEISDARTDGEGVTAHRPDNVNESNGEGSGPLISVQVSPARHPESKRHLGLECNCDQQIPQTIDEFWNEQDDGWW